MFSRLQRNPDLSLYEVMDQHALCRLYFDLEYCKAENTARTPLQDASIVDCLLSAVDDVVAADALRCDRSAVWVLDASDPYKFSQHVIVSMVGRVHLGTVPVVAGVVQQAVEHVMGQWPNVFTVNRGSNMAACVVDTSVYSLNQQLRVPYSSKLGQRRPLLPVNRAQAVTLHDCPWELFESMLVVCSRLPRGSPCVQQMRSPAAASPSSQAPVVSMYPLLEQHINRHLVGGVLKQASLHHKAPLHVPCIYWRTTSRYCPAVAREHKSNHVQVVANVLRCTWRIHCLDPDCCPGPWERFDGCLLADVGEAAGPEVRAWHEHWVKQLGA